MKKRNKRQEAIREIVRNKSIGTQKALVSELEAAGFSCTQATVSRDITDMGLTKLPEGVYVLAEDLRFHQMVSNLVLSVRTVGNLVMVKAQTGTAQGVCAAIDDAALPSVAGTVAGDDTILVVMETPESAAEFEGLINRYSGNE